jgi:hypothetical protein
VGEVHRPDREARDVHTPVNLLDWYAVAVPNGFTNSGLPNGFAVHPRRHVVQRFFVRNRCLIKRPSEPATASVILLTRRLAHSP